MNHNGYYAQALDVIAGTISSPHRSGKTIGAIRGHERDTAQAVAIEREAISAFLERVANYATHPMIGEGGEWRRVVSDIELRAIAQAIRNGEHVKP